MPLPSNPQMVWPPDTREQSKYREWSAWYSGDPDRLTDVYAGIGVSQTPDARVTTNAPWWRFWNRQRRGSNTDVQRAQLHVPIPGDLAAVNAALLFSEEPRIQISLAHEGDTPDTVAKATEDRLKVILERGGTYNRLIEAAETSAAMGGVYLRPVWDQELADHPFLAVAQADMALPKFKWGILTSVLFWREVLIDGNTIFRHLESHETVNSKAYILHGLYRGSANQLGEQVGLTNATETASLQPTIELPFSDLDVQYIPNMRPNRLWRSSPLGMSDYSGSEGLFDALDETYASWMRDIRLAKARIMVPAEYLDSTGKFDLDHEVFTPLTMEPAAAGQGARSIEANQFLIRVDEHLRTTLEFTERIVSNAGYSPQTFGLRIEGRAESGTALRIRENKTFLTQKRKGHWWRPAIERVLQQILILDKETFKTAGIDPNMRPDVDLADSGSNDMVELAQTLTTLKTAMAASTEVRVKMLHPEWTQDQVKTEVEKIKEEEGIGAMASPELPGLGTGGNASGGAQNQPPAGA